MIWIGAVILIIAVLKELDSYYERNRKWGQNYE